MTKDQAKQEIQSTCALLVMFTGDDENPLEAMSMKNVLFEAGVAYGRSQERTVMVQVGKNLRGPEKTWLIPVPFPL